MSSWNYLVEFTLSGGGATYRFGNSVFYSGANRYVPRLIGQPTLTQWMYSQGRTRGPSDIGTGSFTIMNADGAFDGLYSATGMSGAQGTLSAVDENGTQVPLANFVCDIPTADGGKTLTFPFRDWMATLARPLVTTKYAGTGNLEGTADDLAGKPKPLCLGSRYNIEPQCVNGAKQIYQIDGVLGLLTGYTLSVYDRRALITPAAGTYALSADILNNALAPAAGQWKAYPAGGVFRLGSSPVGRVTCDVVNPASLAAPIAPRTTSDAQYIIERLLAMQTTPLTEDARVLLFDTVPAIAELNQKAGIYITDAASLSDTLAAVAESVGMACFWRPRLGLPAAGTGPVFRRLRSQSAGDAKVLALSDKYILPGSLRPVRSADSDGGAPIVRYTVNYQRNSTVMSKTDAPGATDAVLAILAQEYRKVIGTGSQLAALPNNPELVVNTILYDLAAATDLLNYLGGSGSPSNGIYDLPHNMFQVDIPESLFISFFAVGAAGGSRYLAFGSDITVRMTYPRFGMTGGSTFSIIGYQFTGNHSVRLTLWG